MTLPPDTSHDSGAAPGFAAEWVAGLMSVVWCAAVGAYVWTTPAGSGVVGLMLTLLVVLMPLALIWGSVSTLRSVLALRAEAARLHGVVASMRNKPAFAVTAPSTGSFTSRRDGTLSQPSADRKAAMASPVSRAAEEEPSLALGTPVEEARAPLTAADFIRALQFPETAEDSEGFRALRLALEDRTTAKLIRAAQDVLTLLSQEGIYMDDLIPDRARPELWRRFAAGERGRTIAALGGVRDRSSLALTAARMREDTVFRDAGHHFLRSFDKTFAAFEPGATDEDLSDLAETRTARAFMLFGRVTGTFD